MKNQFMPGWRLKEKDRQINYNNIYNLNRLGVSDTSEGGISATYGYEYKKIDKSSLNEQITLGFANNITNTTINKK